MSISKNLQNLKAQLPENVTLVAVSKTKPQSDILEAYESGQRVFGENKIQEMTEKYEALPKDIEWHMIGHVQTNKIKYMASFVHLIHGVDSFKLLKEINKQALKHNRIIRCLLQIKIANEATKFGMSNDDVLTLFESEEIKQLQNIQIVGFMGMATFTSDKNQIKKEFDTLKFFFDMVKKSKDINTNISLDILSMGMSDDYTIAMSCGSNMVRIGSSIFGKRNYNNL